MNFRIFSELCIRLIKESNITLWFDGHVLFYMYMFVQIKILEMNDLMIVISTVRTLNS